MHVALAHWVAGRPVPLACVLVAVVVAAVHFDGLAGLLTRGTPSAGRRELVREAALFQVGLVTVVLAVASPVAYWSGVYIWVHAVQDLMLAFVAPGLIVAGAPWLALRYRWPRRVPGCAPWLLARPVAVVVLFNVAWLAWHVPAAFDPTRAGGGAAAAGQLTYLGAGIAFWLQLIGSRPYSPAAAPLRRAGLIVATVLAGTVLGMVLVFGSGVLYPAYGGAAHHVMTVLDDQQLAGAVLWMGMLPPLIAAAMAVLLGWLRDEDATETSAGLDRLLARPRSSWPSGPGLR